MEILSALVSSLCQLSYWEVLVFSGSFATLSSSYRAADPERWPGFPREGTKRFKVMLVALMSLTRCLVSGSPSSWASAHPENIPSPAHSTLLPGFGIRRIYT